MLGNDTSVSQWVTNAVTAFGWLWVFSLLFAVPAAIWVIVYNMYRTNTVPDGSSLAGAVNPGFVILGVAGGILAFILLLSNVTFGEEAVDATIEQGQDLQDEADDL